MVMVQRGTAASDYHYLRNRFGSAARKVTALGMVLVWSGPGFGLPIPGPDRVLAIKHPDQPIPEPGPVRSGYYPEYPALIR